MFRFLFNWGRTGKNRVGIDKISWRVGRSTYLAAIAILIFGLAFGALTLDKSIRKKHLLYRIVGLRNGFMLDIALF